MLFRSDGMFGEASSTVVIEEFLSGIECSVFVLTDGEKESHRDVRGLHSS